MIALVALQEGESLSSFMERVRNAALLEGGGAAEIRINTSWAWVIREGLQEHCSVWLECKRKATKKWVKLAGPILGANYEELLTVLGKALDGTLASQPR